MSVTKDHIVKEIQRTAQLNGNIPLGRQRFLQETGIKESDWSGKFWVKWSDAIREAGFSPNAMQDATPDFALLDAYASLLNELGHIPTSPEIRMKARNDLAFPSHNTFARLGTKQQLIHKALLFCQSHEKYKHLAPLLEAKVHHPSIELTTNSPVKEVGYVYLLLFGSEYKIGSSNNVERRFREIKTQMPYEGKIIHSIETGDPDGIEAYWHNYFRDKRLKGEWFKLMPSDVAYFKKRKLT